MQTLARGFLQYVQTMRSADTYRQYKASVAMFLAWCAQQRHLKPQDLPQNCLRDYLAFLVSEGYSASTIHVRASGVKQFLVWCQAEGEGPKELPEIKLPKKNVKVKPVLRQELVPQYFRHAAEFADPVRTAITLLPCTGLRSEELVQLPLNCFRSVNVQGKNVVEIVTVGKGGNERIVPVLEEGVEALVAYLRGWRSRISDKRWLFPSRGGRPITTRALRSALQKIRLQLRAAFTPHTMRRTYLTVLYHQGVDIAILAKIAGHSDPKMLFKHYLYLDDEDLARAVHAHGGRLMKGDKNGKKE